MITPEDFERIAGELQSEEGVSSQDVAQLLVSVLEMDQQLLIAQSSLEFTLTTAENLMSEVATACINVIGIRDAAKKRKLAKIAGEAAGRLAGAVQLHIAAQIMQSQHDAEGYQLEDDDNGAD